MNYHEYLIIGGGMTADAAVRGIREIDPSGSIGIITEEFDAPYARPPLSKGLWKGTSVNDIRLHTDALKVDLHLGRKVVSLDVERKIVVDHYDEAYRYEKLLLATGGSPRRLPFGNEGVIYYRTLADYTRLMTRAKQGKSFAVIGGGFIGSEIAAALTMNGKKVSMYFPESGPCARVFPDEASRFLTSYYSEHGVEMHAGVGVTDLVNIDDEVQVVDSNGRTVMVDCVVVGVGIVPRIELARDAGLEVNNGIVVDEFLRTSHENIFAAGDVASIYNSTLGKHIRAEHEDNALSMGNAVGRSMAGEKKPYQHLPAFYSDLFDIGYEAVGDVDARHQTVSVWKDAFQEGVIYYLNDSVVVGVLLWNVWDKVEAARQLITDKKSYTAEQLAAGHPLQD